MGILTSILVNAWPGNGSGCRVGRTQTQKHRTRGKEFAACLIYLLGTGVAPVSSAKAEPLRVATWNVELSRKGPGLLLRDILRNDDPAISQAADTIVQIDPDILLLTGFDWDHGLAAAGAFAEMLRHKGSLYPHLFAPKPNSGVTTGLDMDGDGRTGDARDAQGYGRFLGDGGLLLLSKWPLMRDEVTDFTSMKWVDLPGALLPEVDGAPFPSAEVLNQQRLSSTGHWDIPVQIGTTTLHILAFAATPPVFDGPEDRNGKRNHDENAIWLRYLAGDLAQPPPEAPLVVMGNANLDLVDGEGLHDAILNLTNHPRMQDPRPSSAGAVEAAILQAGKNLNHAGDPGLDTADWSDETGPGNLRVSYVLPDNRLQVVDAGVFWPASNDPLRDLITGETAARHRLVWVDLVLAD